MRAVVIEGSAQSQYGDSEMADVGRQLAARIAAMRPQPTGLVAVNDLLAFGLLAGLREAGVDVPGEVSVIGMDGLFLSALTCPALTTVQLPVPEMAQTIVERVIGRLARAGRPAEAQMAPAEFLFAPCLIERLSVAPPKKRMAR